MFFTIIKGAILVFISVLFIINLLMELLMSQNISSTKMVLLVILFAFSSLFALYGGVVMWQGIQERRYTARTKKQKQRIEEEFLQLGQELESEYQRGKQNNATASSSKESSKNG